MSNTTEASPVETYFVHNYRTDTLGTYRVEDEELHPQLQIEKPHYALTETQYYGFWVPEANLHCFTWIWFHPNLNSVTAGTMAWTGIRRDSLACELFNFHNHMSGDVFRDGFFNARFDNGLSVHAEEPGKIFRIRYDDPARGNRFDVRQVAASDAMMWPSSNHFEQVMRCEGEVVLRGKQYKVDCYSMRDRSWGEYRVEDSMSIPPNHWAVGALDGNNAFTIVGMEDEARNPIWKGKFSAPGGNTLRFGWMIVEGEKRTIRSLSAKADYDPATLLTTGFVIDVTDSSGQAHAITAKVIASTPFKAWQNITCAVSLVEWNWADRRFVGEVQTVMFNDFIHSFLR